MDLAYSKEAEIFRGEVRDFVEAEWASQAEKDVKRFRGKAIAQGYIYRNVPKRYGGGEQPVDPVKATIIREEFSRARAPGEIPSGVGLIVPTLLAHGQEWQREKFIRASITGEIVWCQGYSEPGAGSDLAAVSTRAELVNGEWVINGQKIWTSRAHTADYMFGLIRTEPDAPKHDGISYLLIDMKQPGIDVRPLRQISGDTEFNEVFFTDAKTPAGWIVGERGKGWYVSRTTLKHERTGGAGLHSMNLFDRVLRLAQGAQLNGRRALDDPELRQSLVALEAYALSHQHSANRMFTKELKGEDSGLFPLVNKLLGTNIVGLEAARIARELIGDDGLVLPHPRGQKDWPVHSNRPLGDERWISTIFRTHANVIAGGANNIQRNIISERGLGLPREK